MLKILEESAALDPCRPGVLLHYSDLFVLRTRPLPGPWLPACGDLHHGTGPIEMLAAHLEAEPHDAVLLTFNPALVDKVRQRLRVSLRHATTACPEEAAALDAHHALVLNVPLNHDLNHRFLK